MKPKKYKYPWYFLSKYDLISFSKIKLRHPATISKILENDE